MRERERYRLGLKIYGSKFLDSNGSKGSTGFKVTVTVTVMVTAKATAKIKIKVQGSGFWSRERSGGRREEEGGFGF